MSKDNKGWTQQEDKALKQLKQERGIKKWSIISKLLQEQFQISGKSGKRCRERYQNHLNSQVRRDDWSLQDEERLFLLHNERGNRWVEIAKELQRSDNAVKNHYHSKLRKALRKINKLLHDWLKNEFKPLKNNIISKIIQTAEEYHEQIQKDQPTNAKYCYNLKNQILKYLQVKDQRPTPKQLAELRTMVKEMNQFNKIYKKKSATKGDTRREKIRCTQYKGKEILSLISENKKISNLKSHSVVQDQQSSSSIAQPEESQSQQNNHQVSINVPASSLPEQSYGLSNQTSNLPYQNYNYFNYCPIYNTIPIYSEYSSHSVISYCQNPTSFSTGHLTSLPTYALFQQNQINSTVSVNISNNSNKGSMPLFRNVSKQSNFQPILKQ